jgi:hypothetical protein
MHTPLCPHARMTLLVVLRRSLQRQQQLQVVQWRVSASSTSAKTASAAWILRKRRKAARAAADAASGSTASVAPAATSAARQQQPATRMKAETKPYNPQITADDATPTTTAPPAETTPRTLGGSPGRNIHHSAPPPQREHKQAARRALAQELETLRRDRKWDAVLPAFAAAEARGVSPTPAALSAAIRVLAAAGRATEANTLLRRLQEQCGLPAASARLRQPSSGGGGGGDDSAAAGGGAAPGARKRNHVVPGFEDVVCARLVGRAAHTAADGAVRAKADAFRLPPRSVRVRARRRTAAGPGPPAEDAPARRAT